MRSYATYSFSLRSSHINDFSLLTLTLPLPEPEGFVTSSYNLAYPQILTFCGALIGITLIVLLIKSFKG